MISWAQISGFEWDEGNSRKNEEKHGVSQSEAEEAFFNHPLIVLPDIKHSEQEPRYHGLGVTDDGRQLHITFTLRNKETRIRVVSSRDMHRKERSVYEQAKRSS